MAREKGLFIAGHTWVDDNIRGCDWFAVRLSPADIRRIRQLATAAGRLKASCITSGWPEVSLYDELPVRPDDADLFIDESGEADVEEPAEGVKARDDISTCELCVSEHWVYWEFSTFNGERAETQGCSLEVIERALKRKGGKA